MPINEAPNMLTRAGNAWSQLFPPIDDPIGSAVGKTQELVAKNKGVKALDEAMGHIPMAEAAKNLEDYSKYVASLVETGTYGRQGNWLAALRNAKESGHIERAFMDLIQHRASIAKRNKILASGAIAAMIGIPAYAIMKGDPNEEKFQKLQDILGKRSDLQKIADISSLLILAKSKLQY